MADEQTLNEAEVLGVLSRIRAGSAAPGEAIYDVHNTWRMYLLGQSKAGKLPSAAATRGYAKTLDFLAAEVERLAKGG